jgi:hypothetical protein
MNNILSERHGRGENFQVSYDDIVTKTSAERKSPAVTR